MTTQPDHEILAALKTLRYDLTALQAKLSDLITMAAKLPAPPLEHAVTCPDCGLALPNQRRLAEHAYHVHRGPEPEHYRDDAGDVPARVRELQARDPSPSEQLAKKLGVGDESEAS